MMNEQKMERLLRMAEHPELYDDRELEELMCDEECREAYELMVELGASRGPSKEKAMQSSSQSLQGGGALGGKRLDQSSNVRRCGDDGRLCICCHTSRHPSSAVGCASNGSYSTSEKA